MFDVFLPKDVHNLLQGKKIVFLGDSNIRCLYKDILCLFHNSTLISEKNLKAKMENSVYGDKLTGHGEATNGRNYREERKAAVGDAQLSYYFLTRVYDEYVESAISDFMGEERMPDIIVVNSCLWDVNRWGINGISEYKVNLKTLMTRLKKLLPDCLVIWTTAMPISPKPFGGFIIKELEFLKYLIRFHVLEANQYARKVVVGCGFDVLDVHYHLTHQLHRRVKDGIHWNADAMRYVTNLLLSHISLALGVPLPCRYKSDVSIPSLVGDSDDIGSVVETDVCEPETKQSLDSDYAKEKRPTPKKRRRRNRPSQSHHAFLKRSKYDERRKFNRRRQHQQNAWVTDSRSASYQTSFGDSNYGNNYNYGYEQNGHQYDYGFKGNHCDTPVPDIDFKKDYW